MLHGMLWMPVHLKLSEPFHSRGRVANTLRLTSEDRDRLLTSYQIQWSARPRSRGECAGGIPSGLCLACGFRNPERTTAKLSPQAVGYRSAQPAACPSEGSPNLGKDGGLAVLPVHAHRVPCQRVPNTSSSSLDTAQHACR